MKRMSLFPLLILALLTGCGDGGGRGPTEPSPRPDVNINGFWTGTASSLTARGTCLADSFLPVTVAVDWSIRQTGDSFTATEVLNGAQVCAFTGTVRGDRVTFRPDLSRSQGVCGLQNLACSGLRPVQIELSTSRSGMIGVVDGNRMTITSTTVWRAFDRETGNSLGDYEVAGRQELTR
jgi:hypothetical protein